MKKASQRWDAQKFYRSLFGLQGLVDASFAFVETLSEFAYSLAYTAHQFWDLLSAKQKDDDDQYEDNFLGANIHDLFAVGAMPLLCTS